MSDSPYDDGGSARRRSTGSSVPTWHYDNRPTGPVPDAELRERYAGIAMGALLATPDHRSFHGTEEKRRDLARKCRAAADALVAEMRGGAVGDSDE